MFGSGDNKNEFDGKEVSSSVFYTKHGKKNANPLLPADVQQELKGALDTMSAFTKNEITIGETSGKIQRAHNIVKRINEENKLFAKKPKVTPRNERKTSFLKKAYEIILAGLSKLVDVFKNLKLSKGEDEKFGDLDKESQKNIQQVMKELKFSLPSLSEKGTYNFQGAEQKHLSNVYTSAGTFKKSEPLLSGDNKVPSETGKPTGILKSSLSSKRELSSPKEGGSSKKVKFNDKVSTRFYEPAVEKHGQNAHKEKER